MDSILAFVSVYIFTLPFLIFIFLFSIILEHRNRNQWAACFVIAGILIIGHMLELDWRTMAIVFAFYAPAGIAWSIWRWKRRCTALVMRFKDSEPDEAAIRSIKYRLKASNNINDILSWILSWPISIITSIIGDIIDVIERIVRKNLIGIYNKISASSISEVDAHITSAANTIDTNKQE